jgi:hypothetical protein
LSHQSAAAGLPRRGAGARPLGNRAA